MNISDLKFFNRSKFNVGNLEVDLVAVGDWTEVGLKMSWPEDRVKIEVIM